MFMKENASLSALMEQKEVVDIVFEFANHHYFSMKAFAIPFAQLIMNQTAHVIYPAPLVYNVVPVTTTIDLFHKSSNV